MKFLFTNNASSFLRQDTGLSSVSLTLITGEGAKFPSPDPANDERAMITIEDRRVDPPQLEICRLVSRSTDVLQVIRGQEGTAAQNFLAGARVGNRMTAATLAAIQAQGSFLYAGPWDHDPVAGEVNPSTLFIMPNPIPIGMQYFNTALSQMKVMTASGWVLYNAFVPLDGSQIMVGNLRLGTHDIIFAPSAPGNTIVDGGGGSLTNVVFDEGTY